MSLVPSQNDNTNFMGKMAKIMSNPEFKSFFTEYFSDWSDVRAAIMLMKTYAFIDEEYTKQMGEKLNSEEILEVIKKMMMQSECRKLIVEEMNNFMDQKGKFLQYYWKAIENNTPKTPRRIENK